MGCTTSHDAFAAAVRSRARRASASSSAPPRRADPAALCRERAALIRAAADRRFALAAAHAAYFRSLASVGDALRRFAAAALAPATPSPGSSPVLTLPPSPAKLVAASVTVSSLPPSPSSSSSTVSPLSHSLSDDDLDAAAVLDANKRRGGGSDKASSSTKHHHHYMRRSPTVPNVVYEDPTAAAQYTQAGYGYAYPYGPYGEVVTEEIRPETAAPPSPPTAETSPWDFFDPFTNYHQFMADYSRENLPTNSPNYAELRRMEGIPELEDEAELEADVSSPSTSRAAAQNAKGKGPIPENAASKGEPIGGKLQRKGSEPAPGADDGEVGKPVSGNDSVPSNGSSKTKEGMKKSSATMKATVTGDIDGGSSSNGKKSVAFGEEDSIRPAEGGGSGGESHGKSVQSAVSSDSFSPLHHGTRDVVEAMDEIKEQFDEAVNCGAEVSKLLGVGKVPRQPTPRVLRCGPIFQSSGSSWSYHVDVVLPTKTTWQEVKTIKQQGQHSSILECC